MDVNNDEQIAAVAAEVTKRWGKVDGRLHAIGFMPQDALGGNFLNTPWESVATGFQTSAFSLKALAVGHAGADEGGRRGSSLVSLTFDGRFAWPIYDWMGVAKAGLEATTRYLARDLGPFGDPRQHRLGRADPDHGRQEHPRLRRRSPAAGRSAPRWAGR